MTKEVVSGQTNGVFTLRMYTTLVFYYEIFEKKVKNPELTNILQPFFSELSLQSEEKQMIEIFIDPSYDLYLQFS